MPQRTRRLALRAVLLAFVLATPLALAASGTQRYYLHADGSASPTPDARGAAPRVVERTGGPPYRAIWTLAAGATMPADAPAFHVHLANRMALAPGTYTTHARVRDGNATLAEVEATVTRAAYDRAAQEGWSDLDLAAREPGAVVPAGTTLVLEVFLDAAPAPLQAPFDAAYAAGEKEGRDALTTFPTVVVPVGGGIPESPDDVVLPFSLLQPVRPAMTDVHLNATAFALEFVDLLAQGVRHNVLGAAAPDHPIATFTTGGARDGTASWVDVMGA